MAQDSTRKPETRAQLVMAITAAFAMLWAIARAWVQTITIDEADTYLTFVGRTPPFQWWPAANNHILNSAFMRVFTSVFGLSHLSVRAPALIGAALYIWICWRLCRLLTNDAAIQWPLFVCLVYNPFVFDYLVAARGYGLATAFLLFAIAAPAAARLRSSSAVRACALSSIFMALSFAANFSFAFADLAVLAMMFFWTVRKREDPEAPGSQAPASQSSWARVAAACILPGLLVSVFLTIPTVWRWPKGQLFIGATSLRESFSSIFEASLFQLNPEVANVLVYNTLSSVKPFLFRALGVLVLLKLLLMVFHRTSLRDRRDRWRMELAGFLGAASVLTMAVHWLAFRLFGLLLPMERTALFFVPLCTLIAGAILSVPLSSRAGVTSHRALLAIFYLFSLYFLMCSRLSYFKEWKYDADAKAAYQVVAYYNHAYCVTDVPSAWFYVSSLNFYRKLSGRESLEEFSAPQPLPPGRPVYVVHALFDRDFIASEKLHLVYHGDMSDVAVAVRPELGTQPHASCRDGH